jgi:hypothetical protein
MAEVDGPTEAEDKGAEVVSPTEAEEDKEVVGPTEAEVVGSTEAEVVGPTEAEVEVRQRRVLEDEEVATVRLGLVRMVPLTASTASSTVATDR